MRHVNVQVKFIPKFKKMQGRVILNFPFFDFLDQFWIKGSIFCCNELMSHIKIL